VNYTSLPATGLPDGNYEWWLGAKLSSGSWLWSDTITFTVDVPNAQPPGNITVNPADGRIAVSFDDDPETTWVQIWIGTVPPISNKSYNKWHGRDVQTGNSFTCDGSRCTIYPVWDVGSLDANGSPYTFSVWMRAWGPGGYGVNANGKQWVQMQNPGTTFTLPTQPATTPSNPHTPNPGAIDPQINWTGGANATWYRVYIVWAGSNVPVHNSWHSSVASGCSGALGLATDNGSGHYNCAISGLNLQNKLQQGSAYDIWMTAWGPGGKSTWVKGATFQYGP
jgi:hypothetical protein